MRDHFKISLKYMEDVISRKIPACKWVVRACERQLDDLQNGQKRGLYFDTEKANEICNYVEQLPHTKGIWARRGELLKLEPWQSFILTTVFGWYRKSDNCRRFRTGYTEVARKNAKSTLSSGIGLYMLTKDGEMGAEVYSAATTRDQAKIVFNDSQRMGKKTPQLKKKYGMEVHAHSISVLDTASKMEPLSAEGGTLDGLNIHCAIIDELHAHKTRDVWDVLETATGSRSQPLMWTITTAGSNRSGICYEQRMYVTKLLDRVLEDDSYFGIIYTIDDGVDKEFPADDWTDPKCWAKANPNLGVSVYLDDMERLARKAQQMPSATNNFLTKRLNIWVNADTAWMDMRAWDRRSDSSLHPDQFLSKEVYASLDLSSKTDLAALNFLFPEEEGKFATFTRFYLPEDTIEEARNSQYSGWVRSGYIVTTPGNTIDYDIIEDDIRELISKYDVKEVPYDPFQATQLSTHMVAEGVPMVEMRPTVLNFSEPMKELEAMILDGRLRHDGNPVMTWMISNVVSHMDNKDNIYPRKELPENKIDGPVALIMGLGRAIVNMEVPSVYEERGIRSV